jgi:hypothetical protein
MTDETQTPQDTPLQVQQQPVVDRRGAVEQAPAAPAVKQAGPPPLTREQRRRGGQKAGKLPRHVNLVGLGIPLPTLSLKASDDRLAVLQATLEAVATGKTSGLAAQTVIAIIKEARAESQNELEKTAQLLAERVAELESGRVVDVRRVK